MTLCLTRRQCLQLMFHHLKGLAMPAVDSDAEDIQQRSCVICCCVAVAPASVHRREQCRRVSGCHGAGNALQINIAIRSLAARPAETSRRD